MQVSEHDGFLLQQAFCQRQHLLPLFLNEVSGTDVTTCDEFFHFEVDEFVGLGAEGFLEGIALQLLADVA